MALTATDQARGRSNYCFTNVYSRVPRYLTDQLRAAGVPKSWTLYSPSGEDSFFDSVSEALMNVRPKLKCDSQMLRRECKNIALAKLKENKAMLEDLLTRRNDFTNINDYIKSVDISQINAVAMNEVLVQGVPEVEGCFMSEKFKVQLHVLIYNEDVGKYNQNIFDKDRLIRDKVSYNNTNCIHIVQDGLNQFQAILRSQSQKSNQEMFNEKRAGTINHGIDYETGITTLLAVKCALLQEIEDFVIETNVAGYGAFDDVVLKLTLKSDVQHIFLIQLKYKNNSISYNSAFKNKDGIFFLEKYQESYDNLPIKNEENVHLVLFTNTKLYKISKELELFEEESLITSLVNTRKRGKIFKMRDDGKDDFLSRLLVVTEQIQVDQLIGCLKEEIINLLDLSNYGIGYSCVKEILEHFKIWNQTTKPILKHDVRRLLFDTLLTPYLYENVLGMKKAQHFEVIIKTFNHFNWAFVSKENGKPFLNSVYAFIEHRFRQNDFKMDSLDLDINQDNVAAIFEEEGCKEVLKEKKKINGKITKKDVYLIMCRFKELPMVLSYNNRNKEIIDSVLITLEDIFLKRSIVLVKQKGIAENLVQYPGKAFENLLQLYGEDRELYEENFLLFKGCLLVDEGVKNIMNAENQADVMKTINPNAYIKLMGTKMMTYQDMDDLEYYVERSVQVPVLKRSVLREFTEQFYVIASNWTSISKYNQANVKLADKSMNEIKEEILKTKSSYKSIHILRSTNEYFECLYTKGSVDKLKNHIIFQKVKEENMFDLLDEKRYQIISNNAGMGKTTFLRKYQIRNQTKSWYIFINLNKNGKLLQNIGNLEETNNIKHIFKLINWPTDDSTFEYRKTIFKLFLKNGKVTWIIDGLDEIDINPLRPFLICLKNSTSKILAATRGSKQLEVEEIFNTLCIDLNPFSREDQIDFFKKYLKNNQTDDEIRKKLDCLSKLDENLVGIPLQTKLCADMFAEKENLEKSEFTLINLFEHFLNKKFKENGKYYKINLSKLSLWLFFDQNLLNNVGLNWEEIEAIIEAFKQSKRKDFIISGFNESNEPIFTHRTYAEFLCARWLVEKMRIKGSRKVYIKLYEKLFCNDMSGVRMFFDQIVAEKLQFHLAVLNSDTKKIQELLQKDEKMLNRKDEFGRTALHLATTYGKKIICHTKSDIEGIKSGGDYSIIKETEANFEIQLPPYRSDALIIKEDVIKLLLDNGSQNSCDDLLKLDTIGYSLKSCCLVHANTLCSIFSKNSSNLTKRLNKNSIPLVLYIAVIYKFNNLFEQIVKTENIATKKYNGRNLFFIAVDNSNSEILRKLYELGVNVEEKIDGKLIKEYANEIKQTASYHVLLHIEADYTVKKMESYLNSNFKIYDLEDCYDYYLECSAASGNLQVLDWLLEDETNFKKIDLKNSLLLHRAIQSDNTLVLCRVLKLGFDINSVDANGATPLHLAAVFGNLNVFNYLIENGADCSKLGLHRRNLLHYACLSNNTSVLHRILEIGFEINCVDDNGATPLHLAAWNGNLNVFNDLIEKEADCFKLGFQRRNLLHYASLSNNTAILHQVLQFGFEIDCVDDEGATPLHLTAWNGNLSVLNDLVEKGADYNKLDNIRRNLLHYASLSNNTAVLSRVLEFGFEINCVDDDGATPLHLAAWNGNFNVLNALLEKDADYNILDYQNGNLLHYSCQSNNTTVLNRVLELGFEIDCIDDDGATPIHLAAMEGNFNVFNALIEKGADCKKLGFQNRNLLHYTSLSNSTAVLNRVLELGFEIDCIDDDGATPLHLAVMEGNLNIFNTLLESGADCNKIDFQSRNLLHYASLSNNTSVLHRVLEFGFEINSIDEDGATPILLSAMGGNLNVLNSLIVKETNYNKLDFQGRNLLHYAGLSNNTTVLNRVLEFGFEIDCVDDNGATPLHLAATEGNLNVFNCLIKEGADCNKIDFQGRNLLHYASLSNNRTVLNRVLELGFKIEGRELRYFKAYLKGC